MKNYYFILFFCFVSFYLNAQTNSQSSYQKGYYKPSVNSYVKDHFKTTRNKTNHDNYSTQDNVNPNTNRLGSRAKDYSSDAYNYGSGQTIYTGSRGGQYYINDGGKKVYVPKR